MMFIPYGDNIERRNLPVLPMILIFINVAAFLYQVRETTGPNMEEAQQIRFIEDHYTTWGLIPEALADGQVIGILTHMFVHGGWMHLIGNMLVLWTFSCSLEQGLGSLTLLACYMVWGIIAGLFHCWMEWGGDIPLVGASGAIAGLLGAYTVAYGPLAKIKGAFILFLGVFFKVFKVSIPAVAFGVFWIVMQLWSASNDPSGAGGVAWYAHIGGFLAGAATMLVLKNDMEQTLVRDKYTGELGFVGKDEDNLIDSTQSRALAKARAKAEEKTGALSDEMPDMCPHCKSTVTEEHKIAENLSKCGSCQSLVYPERIEVKRERVR